MFPVKFTLDEGTPTVYKGPPGSDVADLPAVLLDDSVVTLWQFSFEERAAILDGARIRLSIVGRGVPPLSLSVEGVS